jgi:hypothetical protein
MPFSQCVATTQGTSFFGKVVGRGLVVRPTLDVLVEGETTTSKCFVRGFDSLAWQHSIIGPTWVL